MKALACGSFGSNRMRNPSDLNLHSDLDTSAALRGQLPASIEPALRQDEFRVILRECAAANTPTIIMALMIYDHSFVLTSAVASRSLP